MALLLTACGREPLGARVSEEVGVTTYAPSDRVDLPPIAGQTLGGAPLSITDLRGRVVVLNSWASWCEPCKQEAAALVAASNTLQPRGVRFVGLNVTDEEASARQYTSKYAIAYPSIVDAKGTKLASIPGVPPGALPSTLIIDMQGRIAVRIIGVVKEPAFSEQVQAVLAEG
ncbi:MAG: TlpA disulfide reductase family protein [Actinomycetota bacterium]|nr:TlpA disulfide reductase family protein [Actinomycetota bacterium]MDP2289313.1 TlpA disulfide reductase family protein [Actinomycetota bacterium]